MRGAQKLKEVAKSANVWLDVLTKQFSWLSVMVVIRSMEHGGVKDK